MMRGVVCGVCLAMMAACAGAQQQTATPTAPAQTQSTAQGTMVPASTATPGTAPTTVQLIDGTLVGNNPLSPCRAAGQDYQPMDEKMPCGHEQSNQDAAQVAPAPKTYTVPAGTKVLLQLKSSVNTKSAKVGDGVYLVSAFPVVVGNRTMIPAGVYVQGVVDRVQRAGRVKGKAQLDMHFTSIVFPNGSVVEIPGLVNSLPGTSKQQVKDNGEGTVEQDADKTRNMGKVATVAIPTGGTVGSIAGLGSGHPLAGGVAGIAGGVAAAGIVSLFTRGADVNIQAGTQVEMALQRPLILEEENLSGTAAVLVPTGEQPKPLAKPGKPHLLCPQGTLDCE